MADRITLFASMGSGNSANPQIAKNPVKSYNATFTADFDGMIRVYASGAALTLTMDGISLDLPLGSVEYFGVRAGQVVTVA